MPLSLLHDYNGHDDNEMQQKAASIIINKSYLKRNGINKRKEQAQWKSGFVGAMCP